MNVNNQKMTITTADIDELMKNMDLKDVPTGDMPGDQVRIEEEHLYKARVIFPILLEELGNLLTEDSNNKVVVSVHGGSGVGKSEIGSLLGYFFNKVGVGSYVLSGDNYPLRIPCMNDQERERIYERTGREGLAKYLGSPEEIEYDRINKILKAFHDGAPYLHLKRMGRAPDELWYDDVDVSEIKVMIIEWTHGNSKHLVGVDYPILLNSTPEETLEHRRNRQRDAGVNSAFTSMVLEIEQNQLHQQAKQARMIVTKQGELIPYDIYEKRMGDYD